MKSLLTQIKKLIDEEGESLLNDHGVDARVRNRLAKAIVAAVTEKQQQSPKGYTAIVVREGELGEGGTIRVILARRVPKNVHDLAAYGSQHVDEVNPDVCDTTKEVVAIFDDMNPPNAE